MYKQQKRNQINTHWTKRDTKRMSFPIYAVFYIAKSVYLIWTAPANGTVPFPFRLVQGTFH